MEDPTQPRWLTELRRPLVAACALVLLAVLAYVPALSAGFVFDDAMYVLEDQRVADPGGLGGIWTDVSGPGYAHQYYPLTSSMFWLQWQLWGANPVGYHLVNIVLHALCAVGLWRVLGAVGAPGAWLAGAIFAVHPVHVASVAWVSELKNVLSCALMLASLRAFLAGPRWGWLGWACFAGALLSKTAAASMPVALALALWVRDGRIGGRHAARLALLCVAGLSAVAMTAYLEWLHRAGGEVFALGPGERLRVACAALWFYASKLACPWNLVFVYPRWDPAAWGPWTWCWPLSVVTVLAWLWLMRGRLGRGPSAAVAYFVVAVAPVSLVNVAYTRHSYVADHWVYWASCGLIALMAGTIVTAWRGALRASAPPLRPRPLAATACLALIAALGAASWSRAAIFGSSHALWTDTVQRNPGSSLAHYNLGVALWGRGEYARAEAHYAAAAQLDPRSAVARNNWGTALRMRGQLHEALDCYVDALELDPALAGVHANVGAVLLELDLPADAAAHFGEALRREPDLAIAHFGLGTTLRILGRLEAARRSFETAAALDPTPATYDSLGRIARDRGDVDEAAAHFAKALDLDPGFGAARRNLADLMVAPDAGMPGASENRRIAETEWGSNR